MSEELELTIHKRIQASPKSVFEAWLDPIALARFVKPMPGMPDCTAEVDATEGGNFLIVMKAGDTELEHRGEYKTIQRYTKLVFTWISAHTRPDSTVTLHFEELGPQETQLTLHHVGFPHSKARDDHNAGWSHIIEQLTRTVAPASQASPAAQTSQV